MNILHSLLRLLFQKRGYGLDVKSIVIDKDKDFFFGDQQLESRFGAASVVVKPDGQWDAELPSREVQRQPWGDPYACIVYGTENCIQILQKAKYSVVEEEYTERYHSVLIGVKNGVGGSPQLSAESVRKNGELPYHFLPFEGVNSFKEYNSPNPMSSTLLEEGHKWLDNWNFGHDWIGAITPAILKEALKYSPLGIGVYAWQFDTAKQVYVEPAWVQQNHFVCLYGYEEGKYWKIYDSYDNINKKLDWNYPFKFVKRYTMEKKNQDNLSQGKSLYDRLKGKHIILPEQNGEIYDVKDNYELAYEWWGTNSKWLAEQLNVGLRLQERAGNYIGVSNKDFETLKQACVLAGGKLTPNEQEIKNIKDKLSGLTN
jgi:hypothetical protein